MGAGYRIRPASTSWYRSGLPPSGLAGMGRLSGELPGGEPLPDGRIAAALRVIAARAAAFRVTVARAGSPGFMAVPGFLAVPGFAASPGFAGTTGVAPVFGLVTVIRGRGVRAVAAGRVALIRGFPAGRG